MTVKKRCFNQRQRYGELAKLLRKDNFEKKNLHFFLRRCVFREMQQQCQSWFPLGKQMTKRALIMQSHSFVELTLRIQFIFFIVLIEISWTSDTFECKRNFKIAFSKFFWRKGFIEFSLVKIWCKDNKIFFFTWRP